LLRGLADSPTAIESLGINPTASRVLTFCLAGFLGAIAGGLLGTLTQTVNTQSFNFSSSLIWVAVLVAAGSETLGGAVLASALLVAIPSFFTSSKVLEYQTIGFGAAAILLAQTPNGLIGLARSFDFAAMARVSSWRLDGRRRTAERAARLRPAGTVAP
jgi:ABC-type branched-subunit amino acid transport system permease subunit